jgi:hypothetical protein
MSLRSWLWIIAVWVPILGVAWYYKDTYRPSQPNPKLNEWIVKLKVDGDRQCVEAITKALPEIAQGRAAEWKAECLKR